MHEPVLVVACGSGGHLFPAISFVQTLAVRGHCQIHFVAGNKSLESQILKGLECESMTRIGIANYQGLRSLFSPRICVEAGRVFWQARRLMQSKSIKLVVAFGGYLTVPVVLAARSLGIRVLLHEQNLVFGQANRFLLPFAQRIATAFDATSSARAICVGMPLRKELRAWEAREARRELGLAEERKTLVVVGGSQGAHALNQALQELCTQFGQDLRKDWQIVHLTGKDDFERMTEFYKQQAIASRVFSFHRDMAIIYSAADVVMSRAGALTLHELAFFRKRAILIPYPEARAHQLKNARVLTEQGGASLIEEHRLDARVLYEALQAETDDALRRMGARAAEILKFDGANRLADEALRMLE